MRTRSTFHGEHQMLPYQVEPEWVHLSELYNAEKNNLLEVCLEKKFNTEEKLHEKWEGLRPLITRKRKQERLVFSTLNMSTPLCAFMEDVPPTQSWSKMSMYMDMAYQWIQRIRFRHVRSHVHGVCDGLMAASLLPHLLGVSDSLEVFKKECTAPYLITLIKPGLEKNTDQHGLEMAALVRYFRQEDPRISNQWIVVVGKDLKIFLHRLDSWEQQEKILKNHVQRLQRVKKWSGLLDLEDDLPTDWQPNMKLSSGVWNREKEEIAKRIGDITLLWGCDDRHRQKAFSQQIYSWKDERFTPEVVGFTDPAKIATLNRILSVNRSTDLEAWLCVEPSLWTEFPECVEETRHLFVDFEYLANDFIYLVGVWDLDTKQYKSFWADDLSEASLQKMWASFQAYLDLFPKYRCWFWYAEVKMMEKTGAPLDTDAWIDLWQVVRAGVAVRGAFQFGLKNFVSAFHQHGKMPLQYTDLECQDGLASIAMAESYYETRDASLLHHLEIYNRYDCEAMGYIWQEIYDRLR